MQYDKKFVKAANIVEAETGYFIEWRSCPEIEYEIRFFKGGHFPDPIIMSEALVADFTPKQLACWLIDALNFLLKKGDKILDSIKP